MSSEYPAPATDPIPRTGYGDPATLALIALPLALLCLAGSHALSGLPYALPFAENLETELSDGRAILLVASLLSVVFALVPFVLARRGLARLVSSDSWWIGSVLRAAVVLAAIAVVLRLVLAALVLIDGSGGLALLLPYR
jgi:hypothetical protein